MYECLLRGVLSACETPSCGASQSRLGWNPSLSRCRRQGGSAAAAAALRSLLLQLLPVGVLWLPQCFSTFKTRARQAVHSCAPCAEDRNQIPPACCVIHGDDRAPSMGAAENRCSHGRRRAAFAWCSISKSLPVAFNRCPVSVRCQRRKRSILFDSFTRQELPVTGLVSAKMFRGRRRRSGHECALLVLHLQHYPEPPPQEAPARGTLRKLDDELRPRRPYKQ